MLVYILGITNLILGNTDRDSKYGQPKGLQTWEKSLQIGATMSNRAKRFQIGAEITYGGKRDYKPGQGFQIGAEITNCCRTRFDYQPNLYILKMALSENTKRLWK